jgi:hypothetical protein
MKPLISYLFLIILALFTTLILVNQETKPSGKLLTVSTQHFYVRNEEDLIEFMVFINLKNHPLTRVDSYAHVYITDATQTKKLELDLRKIDAGHQESYLKETYQAYYLKFKMPYLDGHFQIEDAYLSITLQNDDTYILKVGSFVLETVGDNTEILFWTSLNGLKKENQFLSRLSQIHIAFDTLSQAIDYIHLGPYIDSSYEMKEEKLIITIKEAPYLLYQLPMIIHFVDGKRQVILNFKYLQDYQILKESGMLINHYALN